MGDAANTLQDPHKYVKWWDFLFSESRNAQNELVWNRPCSEKVQYKKKQKHLTHLLWNVHLDNTKQTQAQQGRGLRYL